MRVRLHHYYIKALREFWEQGVLSEVAGVMEGKQYDLVVLAEGLEQEPHFAKSAEAVAACCRIGGKMLLCVQMPDALDEERSVLRCWERVWAYDLQDIASIFPGFAMLFHMRTTPALLLATMLSSCIFIKR